ncbi:methylosome protein 50 [Plutella xylostella]|uniref:methylosome protein 50 n=1 Tax=Plutella xylostella TaxID=51655 RepID=UPI0020327CE4|nr:methylosome protein 50 [Plutella xylostella]
MCDNLIIPPHLNAEVYRKDSNVSVMAHLDYIRMHNDGTTLIGCSELTGRYWNGGAKVLKTLEADTLDKLSVALPSGTADGCFIQNPDKLLLCQDSGSVSVWTHGTGAWAAWEEVMTVSEHDDAVMAVDCLDPVNHYVTVAADGNIKVWDINEMICENNYLGCHSMMITGVAVKPQSMSFATCSLDRHVSLWDKDSTEKISDLAVLDAGVRCLEWLNEDHLLVGDEAGVLSLIDMRSLKAPQPLITFPAPVHRIKFNKESNNVAVCCDNRIVSVYGISEDYKLNLVYKDNRHNNYVRGMTWHSTDKQKLHTVGWDGAINTHFVQK